MAGDRRTSAEKLSSAEGGYSSVDRELEGLFEEGEPTPEPSDVLELREIVPSPPRTEKPTTRVESLEKPQDREKLGRAPGQQVINEVVKGKMVQRFKSSLGKLKAHREMFDGKKLDSFPALERYRQETPAYIQRTAELLPGPLDDIKEALTTLNILSAEFLPPVLTLIEKIREDLRDFQSAARSFPADASFLKKSAVLEKNFEKLTKSFRPFTAEQLQTMHGLRTNGMPPDTVEGAEVRSAEAVNPVSEFETLLTDIHRRALFYEDMGTVVKELSEELRSAELDRQRLAAEGEVLLSLKKWLEGTRVVTMKTYMEAFSKIEPRLSNDMRDTIHAQLRPNFFFGQPAFITKNGTPAPNFSYPSYNHPVFSRSTLKRLQDNLDAQLQWVRTTLRQYDTQITTCIEMK